MATVNNWNDDVESANITFNGGSMSIGTDATGGSYFLGSGAGNKTVTIGSTNTSSSFALNTGTADISLSSATGTLMTGAHAGYFTFPLTPAFCAYLASDDNNVTGNGAVFTLGSGNVFTIVYDLNSNFVNTGTFIAPASGKYQFVAGCYIHNSTVGTLLVFTLVASAGSYSTRFKRAAGVQAFTRPLSVLVSMTAADTATLTVTVTGEAGNTEGIEGATSLGVTANFFSGYLAC